MANEPKNRQPGYFRCSSILKDLSRFQDLIRHYQRYATQIDFAKPLEELIPEATDSNRRVLIEREINRMIPRIQAYLFIAYVETTIVSTEETPEFDPESRFPKYVKEENHWDLIHDYFDHRDQRTFELMMQTLERGIGHYTFRQERALKEMFNPLHWVAYILRLPITILELSGIEASNKIISEIYAWLIRILVLTILALLATKLGISIPWDKIPLVK